MKKEKVDFRSKEMKEKVSAMLEKSKKMNLIKPHTRAFEDLPVELEQHKGKKSAYRK